jgi:hypothetical protein
MEGSQLDPGADMATKPPSVPDPASSAETYDGLLEDDDALEDASEDRENIFS